MMAKRGVFLNPPRIKKFRKPPYIEKFCHIAIFEKRSSPRLGLELDLFIIKSNLTRFSRNLVKLALFQCNY